MRWLLALFAAFVFTAFAADINGKWKAEMTTPDGQKRETTFNFQADGDKLSGTVQGARGGEAQIENGKISGDEVSFTVTRNFNGNEFKMKYKGTVTGTEMKLTVEAGERSFDMTAKKM